MKILITGTMRTGGTLLINSLSLSKKIVIFNERLNYFRFIFEKYKKINKKNLLQIIEELSLRLKYRQSIRINKRAILKNLKNKELNHSNLFDAIQMYFLKKYNVKKSIWGEYANLTWNYIPNFLELFNDGKVVIIVRDPRAILSSFKKITFLKKKLYLNAIFNWLDLLFFLKNLKKRKIKDKCLITSFESLHRNPKKELKRICSFLNIKYENKMSSNKEHKRLDPKKIKINISSFSNKLVHGFSTKRINNWKNYLENWEIFLCDKLCKKYYKEYKYVEHNFSKLEKIKLNKIIKTNFENNEYLKKLLKKYIRTKKGTDTYPIDPVNPRNWSNPKNPYQKFKDTPEFLEYVRKLSKIRKSI